MLLGEIDLLEAGLEKQQEEISRIEAEGAEEPSVPGVSDGKPRSPEEERQMAIRQYEQEQQAQAQEMTDTERLQSWGITVTRAEDES